MIIRSVFELPRDFRSGLNLFHIQACGRWRAIALVLMLARGFTFAQINPDSAASPPATISTPQQQSATRLLNGVSAPAGYILSPNDQIAVEVFGEDDLRTNGRLNAEGNLSLPLLGSIHLAGLTLTQAASKITELYGRDYLVNPKVNVMLLGYAKRRFSVLGQVNRPGSYELPDGSPGGIDILEAVAMAGGYTRIAAPERVRVRRPMEGGGDQLFKVDAKRLARGEGKTFLVRPGDTITVGESIF